MTTFKELQDDVLFNTFDESKYRAKAAQQLNKGAQRLAQRVLWGWSQVTLPVTAGVAVLPSPGFSVVRDVWLADAAGVPAQHLVPAGDFGIPAVAPAEADLLPGGQQLLEDGFFFATLGADAVVSLRLTPQASFVRVDGYRFPAVMVDDSDACELGEAAAEALTSFARAQLFKREDDPEQYANYMADFDREVKGYAQLARLATAGPHITPGTWGDGWFGGA